MYNLALHYVQNSPDAEEISQDVFVSVYEKLPAFDHRASVSTWIYRITVNKALDHLRARKRRKRRHFFTSLSFGDTAGGDPGHFEHPGYTLEQKQEVKRIFDCLNRLPPNQKTAVILLKIEGLSQQDTAAVMRLSPKAVESLFQRAKKNLEKLLSIHEGT